MNLTYPAIIHEEDGAYWIEFPDLEGCHTFSDSLDGIFTEAREALSAHCTAMLDTGMELPKASKPDVIVPENGSMITVVEAPINDKKRSVKKTLTIPAWLNTAAEAQHINFSQLLQEALVERLGL